MVASCVHPVDGDGLLCVFVEGVFVLGGRMRGVEDDLLDCAHMKQDTLAAIVASQIGGFAAEVTTAVGCAVGQTTGKVGIVLALRRGGNSGLARRLRERPRKPARRFRIRLRAWSDRMVGFLGKRFWGVLIVFLRLPLYSAAVRGDPRRTRDPDVGHLLWHRRPTRADAAVSGDSLRGLRVGQLRPLPLTPC